MRQILLLGALLLAGCANVAGPLYHYRDKTRPDDPCLTIPEQEQRARDQLAIPEYQKNVAPRTYSEYPGPYGL